MIDCSKTENYQHEKARMVKLSKLKNGTYACTIKCRECPLSNFNNGSPEHLTCADFEMVYPDQAIFAIQVWSNENPQKTYLSEFLRHYPRATLNNDGIPNWICPRHLGLHDIAGCKKCAQTCTECWNQVID